MRHIDIDLTQKRTETTFSRAERETTQTDFLTFTKKLSPILFHERCWDNKKVRDIISSPNCLTSMQISFVTCNLT